jgi:hypothetical protein
MRDSYTKYTVLAGDDGCFRFGPWSGGLFCPVVSKVPRLSREVRVSVGA